MHRHTHTQRGTLLYHLREKQIERKREREKERERERDKRRILKRDAVVD